MTDPQFRVRFAANPFIKAASSDNVNRLEVIRLVIRFGDLVRRREKLECRARDKKIGGKGAAGTVLALQAVAEGLVGVNEEG